MPWSSSPTYRLRGDPLAFLRGREQVHFHNGHLVFVTFAVTLGRR
jgi:hypothetical protein